MMSFRKPWNRAGVRCLLLASLVIFASGQRSFAQGAQGRGGAAARPQSAQQAAPADLTGYWVSVVTEDWRFRMVTPAKGDHPDIPLNPVGVKVADSWDPDKDEAAGDQCKAYGAADVMRLPGRLHITWEDENTLRIDTDAGTQTRLLHFEHGQAPSAERSWQGTSTALWEYAGAPGRGQQRSHEFGSLKVVTTGMRAGYLQKNGVPYSQNTVLTEYLSRTNEPNGDSWLVLTAIVDDPMYLNGSFLRSTHYKREADGSKWHPTPCSAR